MNPLVTLRLIQGRSEDFPRATPNNDGTFGGVFVGNEPITYTVWPLDGQEPALTLTGSPNVWLNGPQSMWLISFSDIQTAGLAPAPYLISVSAQMADGRDAPLFYGQLEVFSAAGTATPDDLITALYAAKGLTQVGLKPGEVEFLPDMISAASEAVRSWCNRLFTQAVYVETVPVELDGTIRLANTPVNEVLRVQSYPQEAMSVGNMSMNVQQAWINAIQTGDAYSGITITGINLNWTSNGAANLYSLQFTPNMTINQLATAINAAGNGWSAQASSGFGEWGVTSIIDLGGAKGASPNDLPDGGAVFHVYSVDVTDNHPYVDDGMRTGIWWVGRINDSDFMRWGPEGSYGLSQRVEPGRVRATYNGGFATIPLPVQLAVLELVKSQLERLRQDLMLRSENAADYAYQVNDQMLMALPPFVLQQLARFRVTNA